MTTEPLDRAEALHDEATRLRNGRVMAHQGLVYLIARRFVPYAGVLSPEDLHQMGNLGLMRAAEKFDPGRGWKFTTYAYHCIRTAIQRGIDNSARPIRVPQNARREAAAVLRARRRLEQRRGYRPGLAEVLDAMVATGEVPPGKAGRIRRAVEAETALFGVIPLDEVARECPSAAVATVATAAEHREQLERALPLLDDVGRRTLELRYGLDGSPPRSIHATAAATGVFWRAAGRVEARAVADLARLVGRGA